MFKSKLSFSDYYSIDSNKKKSTKEKIMIEKNNNNQKKYIRFPMAWTCYKTENGQWKCPMNGD